jgi:hypothetical protein
VTVGETCSISVKLYSDDNGSNCYFEVAQAAVSAGAALLVAADGFGDVPSSPCKKAVRTFVYFSAVFGTNDTWAEQKSSGEKTLG